MRLFVLMLLVDLGLQVLECLQLLRLRRLLGGISSWRFLLGISDIMCRYKKTWFEIEI